MTPARHHPTAAANEGRHGRHPDCPICGRPVLPAHETRQAEVESEGRARYRSAHRACRRR